MTTTAIPSLDVNDFKSNIQDFDAMANGAGVYTDRFGKERLTLDEFMRRNGYEVPVAFASGIAVSRTTQTVTYSGVTYHALATAIPFTTTGTFNAAQWEVISGVTRAELASDAGAGLVGFKSARTGGVSRTAQAAIDDIRTPKNVGAAIDGTTDDTTAMSNALTGYGAIDMPKGTAIVGDLQLYSESIEGIGVQSVIKAKTGAAQVLKLGNSGTPSVWSGKKISKVRIDGNIRASDGVSFDQPANPELAGRWTLDSVIVSNAKIGISKKYGNIGNRYRDLSITSCDIGYKAISQASPIMHAGNDVFDAGEANSCDLAAFVIDSTVGGTGGTAWRDFVIEGNAGFGIFVRNWVDSYTPLLLDNVWFEQNATAASVTIDSVAYTPKDLRIDNAALVVIKNGMLPKTMKIVNSNVSVSDCGVNDGPNVLWEIDSASTVIAERMSIDGGASLLTVNSLVKSRRASGISAQVHYAPPRIPMAGVQPAKLQSLPYDGAGPFLFTGSVSVNGTSVADGVIFGTCCELVVPSGATLVQPAVTMTSGKWYVLTVDAKLQSGTAAGLTIQCTSAVALCARIGDIISASWKTIASVSKSGTTGTVGMYINNATGADVTLRLSAWQIMEFNTEQEALNYYNQRSYYK